MSNLKRLIALVLLFITITFNVGVAEVQAETVQCDAITDVLVVVGSVIGTETALAYALGLFGFTAASVAVYENRDTLIAWCEDVKADFIDFCAKSEEWASVTGAKIQNWLEGIGTGVLDKADETYLALKDFCVDIFNKQNSGDVSDGDVSSGKILEFGDIEKCFREMYENRAFNDVLTKFVSKPDFDNFAPSNLKFREYNASWAGNYVTKLSDGSEMVEPAILHVADNTETCIFRLTKDSSYYYLALDISTKTLEKDFSLDEWKYYPYSWIYGNRGVAVSEWNNSQDTISSSLGSAYRFKYFKNAFYKVRAGSSYFYESYLKNYKIYDIDTSMTTLWSLDSKSRVNEALYSFLAYLATCYYHGIAIDGVSFPQDDGISEEDTAGYVLDGSVSDVIERDGTLDNVDVVNPTDVENDKVQVDVEGIGIQDIAKPFPDERTITIDKAVDVVLPDGTPVDEKVKDTSDIKDYTLTGIQKVFPFCIPWDFTLLVKTLSADAKAPKFDWKFIYYDDKGKQEKNVEIDLSIFDSVAVIVRKMELLSFIVALVLITRNIIKG